MGSTASSSAVKKKPVKSKKAGAKKKSVRKSATKKSRSRATPVTKKTRSGKKTTTRKKVAAKKQASRKKTATRPAKAPVKQADVATAPGQDDSKSLSWMAAQAASALKAVKANQNERAQVLLAKSEITPAKPVKPAKPLKDTTIPKPAKAETDKATAGIVTTSKSVKTGTTRKKKNRPSHAAAEPVRNTDKQTVKESPADKPASETSETAAKKIRSVQPTPASNEPAEVKIATITATTAPGEAKAPDETHQAGLPPAVAIAATTTDNGRTRRPFLFAGIIVLLGILGARAWLSDDSAAIQPRVATGQAVPATTAPAVTAVTSGQPAVRPVTVKPQTETWTPTARPAWQARGVAPPAPPVPARNPATQQSGYTPAYGYYYPPQPLRQQHDYWPAYPHPSYSH